MFANSHQHSYDIHMYMYRRYKGINCYIYTDTIIMLVYIRTHVQLQQERTIHNYIFHMCVC